MNDTMEELIVYEALPYEQHIEKLILNGLSSIEKIIRKYLQDCRKGTQRVEDYEDYLLRQLMYRYYHYLLDYHLKELLTKECDEMIQDQKLMIQEDWEFLKKNQYYLKPFPLYREMRLDYFVEKWNTEHVYIPKLLEQIEENKKENENL